MKLNEKLQVLRKLKNLTQSEVADVLYVSRQTVQKWEAGVSSPDLYKLPEISKLFNITIDDLLDESIEEKELLSKILLTDKTNSIKESENQVKQTRNALEWLIIIPAMVGLYTLIFMAYVFGAMFTSMIYLLSAASGVWGLYSIINIFLNISNGAGAILISVGFSFVGIGLVLPLFSLGKYMLTWYKKLYDYLNTYMKNKSIFKGAFKK